LDPQQAPIAVGHEIEVRAVTERQKDNRADAGQPLDRGGFTEVTLLPSID